MRYILQCVLKGDVAKYQKNLVAEIAEKFDLRITKEENLPTHFTLKYWFEAENVDEIENLLKQFCENHSKAPVKVGGFSGFKPKVIFINVNLSNEATQLFLKLISELNKVSWISWNQYDRENMHFHSTIAEECDDKYEEVLRFVQGRERYFNCWFDNITLIKELGREEKNILRWEVHKSFELK